MKNSLNILLAIFAIQLIGCTTIKYVPVTSVQKDSIYVSDVQKDSVLMWTDTNVKQQGDTTIIERTKIIKEIHHQNDVVYKEKVDTIREVVEVERKLTKWEQTKMELGGVAIGGLVFSIIAVVIFVLIKLRK
jgi:cephalosporin-C deacetylase-like acetyl esterase